MPNEKGPGPNPDDITEWITSTFPDTVVAQAMGATFFSLSDKHWPNFATIVTTDEHDMGSPSNLAREGVFRLNIGVGRETFERLVGTQGGHEHIDHAGLDTVIPHPVYAKQRWLAILNPSPATWEIVVKTLITEAHARLARRAIDSDE